MKIDIITGFIDRNKTYMAFEELAVLFPSILTLLAGPVLYCPLKRVAFGLAGGMPLMVLLVLLPPICSPLGD